MAEIDTPNPELDALLAQIADITSQIQSLTAIPLSTRTTAQTIRLARLRAELRSLTDRLAQIQSSTGTSGTSGTSGTAGTTQSEIERITAEIDELNQVITTLSSIPVADRTFPQRIQLNNARLRLRVLTERLAQLQPGTSGTSVTGTVLAAQTAVINNLRVSGSYQTIQYEKITTQNTPTFKIFVTNSSDTLGIQFYYTASATSKLTIYSSGSSSITSENPIYLPPNTGSNVNYTVLTAQVNTLGLDNEPLETTLEGNQFYEDIIFNAVAVTSSTDVQVSNLFEVNTTAWQTDIGVGDDKLGVGYIPTNTVNTVQFTEDTLRSKRTKLLELKQVLDIQQNKINNMLLSLGKGDSPRSIRLNGFELLIYSLLNNKGNINFRAIINEPANSSIFAVSAVTSNWQLGSSARQEIRDFTKGWQYGFENFESPGGLWEGATRQTNKFIALIDSILAEKVGLSRKVPPTVTVTTAPDETSRVNVKVGVLDIDVTRASYKISPAILSASRDLIRLQTAQFFDAAREYKTLVNFGNDKQYLVESWRPVPSDSSSIQLKLTNPLDGTITLYQSASIFRDIAKPVIDTVDFQLLPAEDTTPFLRPLNIDVGKFNVKSQTVKDVTLTSLQLTTGSSGVITGSAISYDDRTFNRWYTSDFNSSELNIDFSDYNNFVTFGSAKARLDAFANKLQKIQSYSSSISVSSSNAGERKLALEKEYIIRNLDPYEQYLYFASQSNTYSASAYYANGGVEYNATGSWPKAANMLPLAYTNVENWYATQSAIAERFDEFNTNYLVKHLPEHIQEDENSQEFITFIQMFGHVMDNLKIYVDQFSQIYSTNPDPFEDLSMDQTYEVAKSFGLDLPNAYSLEPLQSFISTLYDGDGARGFVAETWKRFLHSSIYLRKTKGTRTGADAVLNTYGLSSPLLQIKESSYAGSTDNYIKSDEAVYALRVTGSVSSSIRLPFVSSSFSASSVQIRFLPDTTNRSSILTTTNWGVELVPLTASSATVKFNAKNPSSSRGLTSYFTIEPPTRDYGRIEIVNSSKNTIITSSYFPLFTDAYTHIMLRSASQDLVIVQTDGDQILHQESCSINWGGAGIPQWNDTFIYINGTGSIKTGNFDGVVDDVRMWGENISVDNFIKQAYDPGSYYGTNYSSSYTSLYVDLSFSQKYPAITSSATNETPYVSSSQLQNLPASGFTTASYTRIVRPIKQFTPIVGASMFSNKKVFVAPAPVFGENFIDSDGVKTLSPTDSIKPIQEKQYVGGLEYTQFAISPTDFVNQTMLRSMGDSLDVNYLIGSPRKYQDGKYTELDKLFDFFLEHYNEEINVNDYIRFFRNATKGPTEYIKSSVPARTTLVDGVVIESPILERRKEVIQKAFRVDGRNTRLFDTFVSSSSSISNGVLLTSSINVGAYDFLAEYDLRTDVFPESTTTMGVGAPLQQWGTQRLTSSFLSDNGVGTLDAYYYLSSSVGLVSSTPMEELPVFRRGVQKIGTANTIKSYVSSSFFDYNASSVGFIDAVVTPEKPNLTQTGYGRKIYLGLRTSFTASVYKIASEENTQNPYYEIGPSSDFNDVGATTYFHKNSGLYWFPSVLVKTKEAVFRKQNYRAKLNIPIGDLRSAAEKELASITLMSPDRLTDYPGRYELTIPLREYSATTPYLGVLNIANLFSLFRVQGASGLRLRLYKTETDQSNDLSRPFTTIPTLAANVLFDGLLDAVGEVFPYTLIQTEESTIYYTVDNVGTGTITSNIILNYFEYEPANLVPLGYLPRHYKFTRTNNVATLRKSYKGCKIVYCPEGCPPDVTDPDNRPGKVLPRRLKNGTFVMPDQLLDSTNPVTPGFTPKTSAVVEDLDGNLDRTTPFTVDSTLPGGDDEFPDIRRRRDLGLF